MVLQQLLRWSVQHKKQVIFCFYFLYAFIFVLLVLTFFWLSRNEMGLEIYELGVLSGKIAISLFCVTILPGIGRRCGIRNSLMSIVMLFRRYLGISTFSFAFLHYSSIKLFGDILSGEYFDLSPANYELFGVLSLYIMATLFFTSNDWSVHRLGKWWTRIHGLIYVIAWTLFFHVFLQRISVWSILIGIFAVLETASLIYYYLLRKKQKSV